MSKADGLIGKLDEGKDDCKDCVRVCLTDEKPPLLSGTRLKVRFLAFLAIEIHDHYRQPRIIQLW